MFKKRRNKAKEDVLIVDNKKQENRSSKISTDSTFADENANGEFTFSDRCDQTDGFDSQGFVDLAPAENQPQLLGPKQNCQYIGTFAVSLGTGGEDENTLKTHKERTRFVKKKLNEYRYAQRGVGVAILISTDGIKVISPDGQRVRMAHPLQRISFATCDPEFRLFAYMSHIPSPLGTAIHCHVFLSKYTRQVQNLTALVGKAFQVAFAESKFPKGTELKLEQFKTEASDKQIVQGRRWARLEAQQGHEHSQHAIQARLKKEQEKSPHKSPLTPRKQATPATAAVEATTSSSQASPLGRRRSFGKAHTPPEVRRSNILQDGGGQKVAEKKSSPSDAVTDGSPVAERKIGAPADSVQSTSQKPAEQKFYIPPDKEQPAKPAREQSYTPPLSSSDNIKISNGVTAKQGVRMSPLAKSASDPNMLAANNEFAGSSKHEAVSKRNSHEDENWYMAGIPREFVTEMLEKSEEGSFFVRDSQSKPGCYALTMRVPWEAKPSGFGNFLIVKVKDGVMIQGFDRVLPDVTSLVEHYSKFADGLPCKLLIAGSNVLCEDEEYMNTVPSDPDYQRLSDFTAMMAELK
ncbi:uncharacterized protein LOC110063565 isoform X2 [Orbicella faveolata]|uniref:uncharacterized protein LOC110063564 n=1 Tax=Orbicella faveolata TaxID=48498 RepID=UPI0009E241FA|nr:uncharacterized protein LOC110063564 [Orbicella faveolata]XP_020626221.1 uncharacterized protein LOC110063565 isoform X1 [Orbicella faveolata]XP_020626222.1 uncharacterized protein LOC110063565 isoform X2 [Orbicella faveolata]